MMSRILLLILLISFGLQGMAQKRIGTWRSHLPYENASKLILAGEKVYCITDGGLFYYDQSDKSVEKLSKENGLSDTEISALGYSEKHGITILAYVNSNIDLIQGNTIINFPDIMRKQILGDKRIYSVMINDNSAYLCTGFGIVVLNLESLEITETYIIGESGTQIKVNEIAFDGQYLFAATDQGIYKADTDAPNLQDYQYWQRITEFPDYNGVFNAIVRVDDRVYACNKSTNADSDIIYFWDGLSWSVFPPFNNDECFHLSAWNRDLVITTRYNIKIYKI